MNVRPYADAEADDLVAFLTGETWPFHGVAEPGEDQVRTWIDAGRFRGPDNTLHWIEVDGERVGLVNVQELGDPTPIFDLRIATRFRRRGLGREALGWLAGFVFETLDKTRIEGHTRADNQAMRRVFEACGWLQEAHHREAWPDASGALHDSVAYALLRREWEAAL